MAAKSSEWRPGPTVCRCCLTEGCYKDISTEYFWMGKREVYAEMLKDTLDVSIAYSKAGGPNSNSRLICEPCISRLRDATEFKRQVVECERMFMQHLDPGSSSLNVDLDSEPLDKIKIEGVKLEKGNSDDDFDDRQDFGLDDDDDDDDDDLDNQPLTKLASKVPKKESVDLLDLLDNSKAAEKRKATTKAKAPPPKKAKAKVEPPKPKPTSSKPKPEKKKKGDSPSNSIELARQLPSSITIRKMPVTNMNCAKKPPLENTVTILKKQVQSTQDDVTKKTFPASLDHSLPGSVTVTIDTTSAIQKKMPVQKQKSLIAKPEKKNTYTTKDELLKKLALSRKVKKPCKDKVKTRCATLLKNTTLYPFTYYRGSFLCLYCRQKFEDMAQIEEHVKQHDSLSEDEIYTALIKYSTTELIKLNVREYGCKICNEVLEDFEKLKQHLADKHDLKENSENDGIALYRMGKDNFNCAHCAQHFTTYRLLNIHIKEHYMKFICDQCGSGFINSTGLTTHLKSHESGAYPCVECGKIYKNEICRDEHYKSVHAGTKAACTICGKGFHSYYQKLKHMKDAHNADIPEYRCSYCPKVFLMISYWKDHEKSHLKSTTNTCPICDHKFYNKSSLSRHMIVHSGEKPHKCDICGKAYARRNRLKEHQKVHNDDRDYMCNLNMAPLN